MKKILLFISLLSMASCMPWNKNTHSGAIMSTGTENTFYAPTFEQTGALNSYQNADWAVTIDSHYTEKNAIETPIDNSVLQEF